MANLIRGLPIEGAFYRSRNPEAWTLEQQLLAGIINVGQARMYQAAGGKGRKPTPVGPQPKKAEPDKTFGSVSMTPAELDEVLRKGAADDC